MKQMQSVLLSTRPKWCGCIASGKKKIEVRKTRPKIETPFKCYIYETKARSDMPTFVDEDGHVLYTGRGQVIGEFVCDRIDEYSYDYCDGVDIDDDTILETALDREDINIYAKGKTLYGWHISNLKIYDKPRELDEFYKFPSNCHRGIQKYNCDYCFDCQITRPPQSWCYVEDRI